jgi:hypothetical protein
MAGALQDWGVVAEEGFADQFDWRGALAEEGVVEAL